MRMLATAIRMARAAASSCTEWSALASAKMLPRLPMAVSAGRNLNLFAIRSWWRPLHAHGGGATGRSSTSCSAAAGAAGASTAVVALLAAGSSAPNDARCAQRADAGDQCPQSLVGVWSQDMAACESMGPFLGGLGVPWFAWPIVDQLHTALHITAPAPGSLQIEDQTLFGTNTTRVQLDGSEVEKKTRGGRKSFMLSGHVASIPAGAQESQTSDSCAIITCRLFQRGEGWSTRMERYVEGGRLVERNVLTRPGQEDVVVVRSLLRPLPFE